MTEEEYLKTYNPNKYEKAFCYNRHSDFYGQ